MSLHGLASGLMIIDCSINRPFWQFKHSSFLPWGRDPFYLACGRCENVLCKKCLFFKLFCKRFEYIYDLTFNPILRSFRSINLCWIKHRHSLLTWGSAPAPRCARLKIFTLKSILFFMIKLITVTRNDTSFKYLLKNESFYWSTREFHSTFSYSYYIKPPSHAQSPLHMGQIT